MKKSIKILPFILVIILSAVMIIPAGAARPLPTTGAQINVLAGGDRSIGVGEPFYIMHGWTIDDTMNVGQYDFKLDISGVSLKNPLRFINMEANLNMRIYNFPDGLPAGSYAYTATWFAPCGEFFDPATCSNPHATVEAYSTSGNLIVNP